MGNGGLVSESRVLELYLQERCIERSFLRATLIREYQGDHKTIRHLVHSAGACQLFLESGHHLAANWAREGWGESGNATELRHVVIAEVALPHKALETGEYIYYNDFTIQN